MKPLTCFDLNIQDHIAHLVLNRPQALNTLDLVFWRELDDVLQALLHLERLQASMHSSGVTLRDLETL